MTVYVSRCAAGVFHIDGRAGTLYDLAMRLTLFLLACAALYAQADSISGTWKGDIAPAGSPSRRSVSLTLKLEGNTLTGTASAGSSIPIKNGSFDSKTGAIKFEVEPPSDGKSQKLTFEGIVVDGTALGHVTSEGINGNFKFNKTDVNGGVAQAGNADLRRNFASISLFITKAAEMAPADKYGYRPSADVRSFGQIVAHLADSYRFECGLAMGKSERIKDPAEKGAIDKDVLLPILKQATDACIAAYNNGQVAALTDNLAHSNLHYGNLITYLRLMGLKPPSTN
jgi:hypothetical protein